VVPSFDASLSKQAFIDPVTNSEGIYSIHVFWVSFSIGALMNPLCFHGVRRQCVACHNWDPNEAFGMHNFCFSDGGQTSMHFFYCSFSEYCVNVFQSLDRQSFVEFFMVMLVVKKYNLNEVSQFSLVLKRVVVLIVPFVCRRKLKKLHLSIHTML